MALWVHGLSWIASKKHNRDKKKERFSVNGYDMPYNR